VTGTRQVLERNLRGERRLPAIDEDRAAAALVGVSLLVLVVVDVALFTRGHALAGAIADALLLFLLLNFDLWRSRSRVSEAASFSPVDGAVRAVALVALARVVAAGMPVARASDRLAALTVALAVGFAALRMAPLVGVSLRVLFGASPRERSNLELKVVAGGAVLGLVAYAFGGPDLVAGRHSPGQVAAAYAVVTLTVVAEELVFHGILQSALQRLAARLGFVAAAALFVSGYLGGGSAGFVLTIALAAVLFGYAFALTSDLASVAVAHWLLAAGAFVAWPLVFGRSDVTWLHGPVATALLAIAVVATAALGSTRLPRAPGR
jgi:membrane protease YdiL (CAAX protease family)